MSFSQVAKLFVRGSVFNKFLKEMPEENIEEIGLVIEKVIADPNLQRCRREFCNALARTIRNEYVDREAGEADYQIAVLKSILEAKMKFDSHDIFADPLQRKKWVQNFVFNYLRQILRENKRALHKRKCTTCIPLEDFILNTIMTTIKLNTSQYTITPTEMGYNIEVNTFLLSVESITMLNETKEMYFRDVEVIISTNSINIRRVGEQKFVESKTNEQTPIREQSFDQDNNDEESSRDILEARASKRKEEPMDTGIIDRLKQRVPERTLPILTIYLEDDRPQQYIKQFGEGRPKIAHISKFLGISPQEVKKELNNIKINYRVVSLGY